jgi:hypothetical protein
MADSAPILTEPHRAAATAVEAATAVVVAAAAAAAAAYQLFKFPEACLWPLLLLQPLLLYVGLLSILLTGNTAGTIHSYGTRYSTHIQCRFTQQILSISLSRYYPYHSADIIHIKI